MSRNLNPDQFVPIPWTVQSAGDEVARQTGSSRTYPPGQPWTRESDDRWEVQETTTSPDEPDLRRTMVVGPSDEPIGNGEMPEGVDYDATLRDDSLHVNEGPVDSEFEERRNTEPDRDPMQDVELGRSIARDRFGYGDPEWERIKTGDHLPYPPEDDPVPSEPVDPWGPTVGSQREDIMDLLSAPPPSPDEIRKSDTEREFQRMARRLGGPNPLGWKP